MEYLIPLTLLLLVVTGFVLFITFYSTSKGGPGEVDRSAGDTGDSSRGMGADDSTALGSSDQLAQERSDSEPTDHEQHGQAGDGEHDAARSSRFTHDGSSDLPAPAPESERLADRGV
jgi:hypothetical protein